MDLVTRTAHHVPFFYIPLPTAMRSNLISLALFVFCFAQQVSAQNANPFELLWRKDTTGLGASMKPMVIPETAAPPPVIPTPPVITTEISPAIVEPTITVIDTPLQPIETVHADTLSQKDTIIHTETSIGEKVDTSKTLETPVIPSRRPDGGGSPLGMVLLFGLIFSILAWGLSLNRDLLRKIYRAALNENLSSLLYREQRFATTQYLYYTIYVIFFLNGGLFLYFLSQQFGWNAWTFRSIWSSIGLVTVVYLLRHLSLSILGNVYPMTKEATHFSFSILLHNILLGIGLIPVNLFLAFGPDGMQRTIAVIGLIFCGLIYLIRQFRGLLISGSTIATNPFHFFVYLCAVEILPMFTLVKFFHN